MNCGKWTTSARRRQRLLDSDTFIFLNQKGRLSELGWDMSELPKLWRYHQHYFEDLSAFGSHARSEWHVALILNWTKGNKPGLGTGWEPYPTSLRIVNWVKWQLSGHTLPHVCLQSLAVQTRWLAQKIEWHILGNHLFANAKALVFAGLFFEGLEAQRWLDEGLDLINQQIREQILPDGGNFERSPMYHTIFLEDILDLINLSETYPGIVEKGQFYQWCTTSIKMLNWLESMCHPDGEIAFFNDASIGIAPTPEEIKAYSSRLGFFETNSENSSKYPVVTQFADSGYLRLSVKNAVALLDVAPIGPDYLPGHAHADTLSFELSLFDERIFVNGGTSEYGNGVVRQIERGTASHNTVQVNDENSSEVWSSFRVARRAYPFGLKIEQDKESVSVSCSHDGYTRLPGQPVHNRKWVFSSGRLVVLDRIKGKFTSSIARFHINPSIQITNEHTFGVTLRLPNCGNEVTVLVLKGMASIENSYYSPEFGVRLETKCLVVRFDSAEDIAVEISWSVDE